MDNKVRVNFKDKKISKKKLTLVISLGILIIIAIVITSLYIANINVRNWMDMYIFRKNVIEERLDTIDLENENSSIYAYDNHIVILENNVLSFYNQVGKKETSINVSITTPIFESSGNYLLVADKGGKNVYLIYNTSLQWQKTMDGNVSEAVVNKNGAVGVVLTGTTYKSVIVMYGITGNEEFKTYLSSTIAVDIAISENSQNLSFAEINTSGTIIDSVVKTISVEKAKNSPAEAIINTYKPESNSIIVKLKYNKEKLICQYDNSVYMLNDGNSTKLLEINNNSLFVDINVLGYICNLVENQAGILTSEYELKIMDVDNKKESSYILNSMPKSLYCSNNIIGINMGNDIEFVNHNGWLIKSFSSKQSFKDVVIGEKIIGIVYKDRVELITI